MTSRYTSQAVIDTAESRMAVSLTSDLVLDVFRRLGALHEGHFRLTSGLHSPGYLQCALVLQYPREAEALGAALAERASALRADVVLSPALGGIVIGQEVGRALGVRAISPSGRTGASAYGAASRCFRPTACWWSKTW